jgi:hypothetical protein
MIQRLLNPLLAASLLLPASLSAQGDALAAALRECQLLSADAARLACYDRLPGGPAAAAASNAATAAIPAASRAAVAEAAAAPAATSNSATAAVPAAPAMSERVERFGQSAQVLSNDAGSETLIDVVSSARRVEPTKWLLTLQSGQVWRQTVGKDYLVRPGDQVRISSSDWGNDFRLSVEGRRGYIQVSRVQQ